MKDRYGNTYEIGDKVVHAHTGYRGFRSVTVGKVVKLNPKTVKIVSTGYSIPSYTNIVKPHTAVIINKIPDSAWEGE